MRKLEVKPYEKGFGLFLGETLIGTSKLQCDAELAKQVLTEWAEEHRDGTQ